jgi:hypothetical protein
MVNCWAQIMGNCSDKQSAEHLISKAVMNEHGPKNGPNVMFDSKRGTFKTVGPNAYVSNILCSLHNTELSNLDAEAAKTYAALKKLNSVNYLKTLRPNNQVIIATINGNFLERGFIKTAIDHIYGYAYKLTPPPKQLVELVYGRRRFPEFVGLSSIAHTGYLPTPEDKGVTIVPIIDPKDNHLCMTAFDFAGWRYVIPMIPNWNLSDIWKTTLNNTLRNPPNAGKLIDYCRTGHVAYHTPGYAVNIQESNITAKVNFTWNCDMSLPLFIVDDFIPWFIPSNLNSN